MKESDKETVFVNNLSRLIKFIRAKKAYLTVLSCIVVFITTYVLILPAITLDEDEAQKQGGIDLPVQTEQEEQAEQEDANILSHAGKGYEVTIDSNALPEDTELVVEEIQKKDQDYDAYYEDALEAVQSDSLAFAKFYDISLLSDGESIEPDNPLNVTISYDKGLKADDADHIRIVHFAVDEETGEVEPEVLDPETVDTQIKSGKMTEATFEAASFSVYAIVYTVDFHWEVDGKKFEFKVPGGGYMSFGALMQTIGIVENSEEAEHFLADVEEVVFSDPNLMWVGRAEEETTVGALKEENELECQYSAELSEEQIDEINTQTVEAGDWALISIRPFTSEESLTVFMKDGDVFTVKVTDSSNELDGKTVTISNNTFNLFMSEPVYNRSDGKSHLNALEENGTDSQRWTLEWVNQNGGTYRIKSVSNGRYLMLNDNGFSFSDNQSGATQYYIDRNGSGYTISTYFNSSQHYVIAQSGNNNKVSYIFGDNAQVLTITDVSSQPSVTHHVTVHYVDRNGNPLTGVQYRGGNSAVVPNSDGTFTIPYNVSGNVDLRANFNFDSVAKEGDDPAEYTYANTHLAGDGDYSNYTYKGYIIDSVLYASNGNLAFRSDSGETSRNYTTPNTPNYDPGNKGYGALVGEYTLSGFTHTGREYSLSGTVNNRPSGNEDGQIAYAQLPDKDIYVVLDPLPGENAASPISGSGIDAAKPKLTKKMVPNEDGTYTLKLTVDAHARNASETNRANILFIVDTSSSMRNKTTSDSNRIEDTHDAALEFGDRLLKYNEQHPDAIEIAMLTFDGDVEERLGWTKDQGTFDTAVNEYLRYYYLHQGTDWEDAMATALGKVLNPPDDDPFFVVFFTDGEPSQYTNFHGAQTNPNEDPTGHNTDGQEAIETKYPNFYSYFLSREGSKDEMRAIVDAGAQLYGVYAYNTTNESYNGYNGAEDGAKMLHNALRYGYNTTDNLEGNLFYEARSTTALQQAFDKIFNLITEKVGFENVTVNDGIADGVTSTTVLRDDVSAFTYVIKDDKGQVAYEVTVAPNGVPEGTTPEPDTGTPIFKLRDGSVHIGEIREIPVAKIVSDSSGNHRETVQVPVYYYFDEDSDKEYIMPISTTGENINWDLSPLGMLKDGYSYELSFVVWPNQDAYDLVADLNNGNPQNRTITEDWSDSNPDVTTHEDANHRVYKIGGIKEYPYISRYENTGEYCAMSNSNQSVDYHKVDEKIVNGQEQVTIGNKVTDTVPPPDPMPLNDTKSRLEKLWNYERDPGLFAQYLFKTNGDSKEFKVDFDIFQGSNTTDPYTTVSLGWDPTANNGRGAYVWAPGDTMTNVTYAGHPHQIGTRWVNDFGIATGLMLTMDRMVELGLNPHLYPSAEYEGETYYILEPGHDYTIKEHQEGTIGYEFDFHAPVYHPMLVNGVLKNVEIEYETDQGQITSAEINSITGSGQGLSGLEIQNTLRGYINLNKIVVDEEGERVAADNTKFEYTIWLESPTDPGPFVGDHIPWYGINGLYYNDGHENYYQVYETQNHVWMIKNEAGREYPVTSTGFDPDEAGEQTVTYEVNGQQKQITLYGNQMTSTDGKTATATLAITQNETLYIANIPEGTEYTITEADIDEYDLIDILKEVRHGADVEQSEQVADLSARAASGTIVTNRDNHVTYTNQIRTGELKITKTIQKNGSTDTSATGTFYYAVYDEPYDANADPAQTPVRTGSIEVTSGGTKTVTESDLKIGDYYVYELSSENGTPVSGGFFTGGKYYAVSTTGSPATVTEDDEPPTVAIVNNYETAPVTATKSWADSNPQGLTVYFKLFYETSGGVAITTGTPLKPLLAAGVTSVTWEDMPKYDENGQEYNYIVREYVIDDTNGEFEEGDHRYTEAAPNGYVNTEAGLSVTNSKLETYEPVTTYSGLKVWVDTVNGSMTRPDGLTVTLMIDKEPYDDPEGDVAVTGDNGENLRPDWVTVGENQWRYTFTKLPMFDEQQKIIRYYAVETPVQGYTGSITNSTDTRYVFINSTLAHTTNDAYLEMSSDADLVYTAVRIQHDGYLHHIWTQRVPTNEEKNKLIELVNQDLADRGLADPAATVNNVHWFSGLPIDHEFVYKPEPSGYKIKLTRHNTNTIYLDVRNHRAFSNICYGTLQYNYTAGSTDFRNELQPVSHSVEKTWGNGITPPAGAVINVQLYGTIQRKVEPQPVGQTDPQYETVPVDLASVGVTQTIQVTLNGGAQGGDDTAADPWKYTWSNLPPCDKAGNAITYGVREVNYTIGGHTVSLTDFAPGVDTGTADTTILTNQIPAFSFDILKIDAGSATPLQGAEFKIREIQPTSNVSDPTVVGTDVSSDPETTGANGKVTFNNIPLGYYEVEETKLPTGYLLTGDGKFYIRVDTNDVKLLEKVVAGDGALSFREVQPGAGGRIILNNVELSKSGVFTFTVENTSGAALPNSGGPGTTWIYLIGSMLLIGCGIALVTRRRVRKI